MISTPADDAHQGGWSAATSDGKFRTASPCHKTIWRCPAAGPNATTSTSHWGRAATPADPAFPARLVERCERQLNLRLDTFCPGGPVARCRNGRITPQCGIAGIRLAACICRRPIQHPPLLVAPCSITRYPFRRLLGHRKTLDTPVVRSRTARVPAMGDRSAAGTATFSVNEHRHDEQRTPPRRASGFPDAEQ